MPVPRRYTGLPQIFGPRAGGASINRSKSFIPIVSVHYVPKPILTGRQRLIIHLESRFYMFYVISAYLSCPGRPGMTDTVLGVKTVNRLNFTELGFGHPGAPSLAGYELLIFGDLWQFNVVAQYCVVPLWLQLGPSIPGIERHLAKNDLPVQIIKVHTYKGETRR